MRWLQRLTCAYIYRTFNHVGSTFRGLGEDKELVGRGDHAAWRIGKGLAKDGELVGGSKGRPICRSDFHTTLKAPYTLSNHPTAEAQRTRAGTSEIIYMAQARPLPGKIGADRIFHLHLQPDKCDKTQMRITSSCPCVCQINVIQKDCSLHTAEKQVKGQEDNAVLLRCPSIESIGQAPQ